MSLPDGTFAYAFEVASAESLSVALASFAQTQPGLSVQQPAVVQDPSARNPSSSEPAA